MLNASSSTVCVFHFQFNLCLTQFKLSSIENLFLQKEAADFKLTNKRMERSPKVVLLALRKGKRMQVGRLQ